MTETTTDQRKPTNPVFYKNPQVLSAELHGEFSLLSSADFSFARPTNSLLLGAIELPAAMHHYPIVFTTGERPAVVAVLGVEGDKNLFIDDDGQWQPDTYVPAYVRRYPFIFLERPDFSELILCIDADCDRFGRSDEGRLFADGQPSELTRSALALCRDYHEQLQVSASFVAALADSNLLVANQARLTTPDGRSFALRDFRIIDEAKFNELSDDVLLDWYHRGWLKLIYAHLFSMTRWGDLLRRL